MTVSTREEEARAAARAAARLRAAVADLTVGDDGRLDERARHRLALLQDATVAQIETDLRRHAARLLSGRGADAKAETLLTGNTGAARLMLGGHLLHLPLLEELIARVRLATIAEALRMEPGEPEQASLLVRLANLPDRLVSRAAKALLVAEAGQGHGETVEQLPAELHHWLVWRVTAAIRAAGPDDADTDRALVEAAQRALAAHNHSDSAEALAEQLAAAIDALPNEVAALLTETLVDRRLTLFIAVLARALGIEGLAVRELVLDPQDERLWRGLRGAGLDREAIARVGLALADADPRRDLEAFVEQLDTVAAADPAACRSALSALALPLELRRASRALDQGAP